MVQILPPLPTFGEKLREALSKAQADYYAGKEKGRINWATETLGNPNASLEDKNKAIRIIGDPKLAYKYSQDIKGEQALQRYRQLKNPNQPTNQVTEQDVGGQAQESTLPQTNVEAPKLGAPSQVLPNQQQMVPQQGQNQEAINEALLDISRYNPQMANILQKQESMEQKQGLLNQQLEQKFKLQQQKLDAQSSMKNKGYLLDIQKESQTGLKQAEDSLLALNSQLDAVNNGDVSAFSGANLSAWLSEAGYPRLSELAQSEGGAVFNTAKKQLFAGAKNIFGARISNLETSFYDAMQAATGRNPAANRLVIYTLMLPQLMEKEANEYRLSKIDEDPNIDAVELNSDVSKHMNAYRDVLYERFESYLNKTFRKQPRQALTKEKKPEEKQRKSLAEIFK